MMVIRGTIVSFLLMEQISRFASLFLMRRNGPRGGSAQSSRGLDFAMKLQCLLWLEILYGSTALFHVDCLTI